MTAGESAKGGIVGKSRSRKYVEIRRRTRRLAPGVVGLCLVMILASLTLVVSPAMASGIGSSSGSSIETFQGGPVGLSTTTASVGGPLLISPGTWVTFTCTHGTISLDATQYCSHTTTASVFLCDTSPSCPFTMVGTVDSGYTFYGWLLSGQASVSCEYFCLTTALTVSTPNPSNHYTASVQLDTTSSPPPPPTCGGAPTISAAKPVWQNQSGLTRQIWVNWSYSIPSTGLGWSAGFSWYQGSTQLEIPSFNSSTTSASVNLNALTAGTTYSYTVGVSNCGGPATKSGTFTTSNAPINEYAGWVYQQYTGSPWQLNPVGRTMAGISIVVGATCYSLSTEQPTMTNFSATTTNSRGFYTVVYPMKILSGGIVQYELFNDMSCVNTYENTYWNTQVALAAVGNPSTFISESRTMGAPVSLTADYQEFILPQDVTSNLPIALSLLHTPYAQCGFSYVTSFSYTVDSYVAGNGYTDSNSTGQAYYAPNVTWGQDTGMELSFTTTGIVSDNIQNFAEAWAVGAPSGSNQDVYTTTEWVPTPPAWNGTYVPSPYQSIVALPAQGKALPELHGFYDGGTFSATTGVEMDVGVGIDISFVSFEASVPLTWTISQSSTTSTESTCYFYNPNTDPAGGNGGQALFYYEFTGAPFGTQTQVIHVWFMGYCGGSNDRYGCP